MDAYDRCTNLGKKIIANSVALYGQCQELFRPPIYLSQLVRHFKDLCFLKIFLPFIILNNKFNLPAISLNVEQIQQFTVMKLRYFAAVT
jgi:hypothetical protein